MEELQNYFIIKLEGRYVVIKSYATYSELVKQAFDVYAYFDSKWQAHNYRDYKNGKITQEQLINLNE
tara:strand:+ start:205 stop:405 length:201 start_codon:yes stop_codon:yes gene_type:complete